MKTQRCFATAFVLLASVTLMQAAESTQLRAALMTPSQASAAKLKSVARDGFNAAVLFLDDAAAQEDNEAAGERIRKSGLALYYWIEIARNPTLAGAHPDWMASVQTHPEWRRHFPEFPKPATNQVVKTFPWVPVL